MALWAQRIRAITRPAWSWGRRRIDSYCAAMVTKHPTECAASSTEVLIASIDPRVRCKNPTFCPRVISSSGRTGCWRAGCRLG